RARLRPNFWAPRHERIERRRGEHADLAEGEAPVLLELPEIEHLVADRDSNPRRKPAGGEHAIGKILDREIRVAIDRNEGAEFWVVGMGHVLILRRLIVMAGLDPAMTKFKWCRSRLVRIESFLEALPAIGVVILQRCRRRRILRDPLRKTRLEHEGQRAC